MEEKNDIVKNLIRDDFERARNLFLKQEDVIEGSELINKITKVINEMAKNFISLDGGDLSDYQIKLSGYKYYLADQIANLDAKSKYWNAWIKDQKARLWDNIKQDIIAEKGKVQNREEIENALTVNLKEEIENQLLYESQYQRLKLKSFAMDDILTVIVQRVASIKREFEQSKQEN